MPTKETMEAKKIKREKLLSILRVAGKDGVSFAKLKEMQVISEWDIYHSGKLPLFVTKENSLKNAVVYYAGRDSEIYKERDDMGKWKYVAIPCFRAGRGEMKEQKMFTSIRAIAAFFSVGEATVKQRLADGEVIKDYYLDECL